MWTRSNRETSTGEKNNPTTQTNSQNVQTIWIISWSSLHQCTILPYITSHSVPRRRSGYGASQVRVEKCGINPAGAERIRTQKKNKKNWASGCEKKGDADGCKGYKKQKRGEVGVGNKNKTARHAGWRGETDKDRGKASRDGGRGRVWSVWCPDHPHHVPKRILGVGGWITSVSNG